MTGTGWIVVGLLTIWLLIGTVVLVLVTQQVATLTALLARSGGMAPVDNATAALPPDLVRHLPAGSETRTLVFISDSCSACHELLEYCHSSKLDLSRVIWVMLGDGWSDHPSPPSGQPHVTGRPAQRLFQWGGTHSVPSAACIRGNVLEAVHPVLSTELLRSLCQPEQTTSDSTTNNRLVRPGGHSYARVS